MMVKKIIFFILFLNIAIAASADCDTAYQRCVGICGEVSIYEYVSKKYLDNSETDFKDRCAEACLEGKDQCASQEDVTRRCEAFQEHCEHQCPGSVYNYLTSQNIASLSIAQGCQQACEEGSNACDKNDIDNL